MRCYLNRDWKPGGIAVVFAVRRLDDRSVALGAFLIDIWCMGLTDAWGRLDLDMGRFESEILRPWRARVDLVETDPGIARRLVAGAIRFSRENGFSLPRRYELWLGVLGDVGDPASAPLDDFRRDGELVVTGDPAELGRRLVGQSLESFLAREDVRLWDEDDQYRFLQEPVEPGGAGAGPSDENSEAAEAEAFEEAIESSKRVALEALRRWCAARGLEPHPRLEEAWELQAEAILQVTPDPEAEELPAEAIAQGRRYTDVLLSLSPASARAELRAALIQIGRFLDDFDDADSIIAAMREEP